MWKTMDGKKMVIHKNHVLLVIIVVMFILCSNQQIPDPDARNMKVLIDTKVFYYYERPEPLETDFLIAGTIVRARPTEKEGWYRAWYKVGNKWRTGFIEKEKLTDNLQMQGY